jgi:hypothetical protein
MCGLLLRFFVLDMSSEFGVGKLSEAELQGVLVMSHGKLSRDLSSILIELLN